MKKHLLKAMPHVPILELRPELREQNEVTDDPDDQPEIVGDTELNTQSTNEGNAAEVEANTTFHNFEAEHTGANVGLVQRVKKFISKRKANNGNIVAGRIGVVKVEDDNMVYGDDESSESDTEGDDGIPLVRRSKRN